MKAQQEQIVKLSLENMALLDICANIETKCAELYRHFSELYVDIPEISALWNKTADEEDNHSEQFKLAVRLRGAGMEGVKADRSRVAILAEQFDSFIPKIKGKPPTPAQALTFAIQLEEKLFEYHMSTLVDFSNSSLEKLFTSMANNDKRHIEMLHEALKKMDPRKGIRG